MTLSESFKKWRNPNNQFKSRVFVAFGVGAVFLGTLTQVEPSTLGKSCLFNPTPFLVLWVDPSCYQLNKSFSTMGTIAFSSLSSTSPWSACPLTSYPQLCFVFRAVTTPNFICITVCLSKSSMIVCFVYSGSPSFKNTACYKHSVHVGWMKNKWVNEQSACLTQPGQSQKEAQTQLKFTVALTVFHKMSD